MVKVKEVCKDCSYYNPKGKKQYKCFTVDCPAYHNKKLELPYLEETIVKTIRKWNPKYDQMTLCECGHIYHIHFDSYDDMSLIGCKYCGCLIFKKKKFPRRLDGKWCAVVG